jgi:geranylgeranyl diphosphate synthase type II
MENRFDLSSYLKDKKSLVEKKLDELSINLKGSKTLNNAQRYSLLAGGKRLRPVLCLAAEEACGSYENKGLLSACALEMIHTYSLIHDDLPCMDDDDLRRGILTCHKKFGEPEAVLAGDALLTKAFEILSHQDLDPSIIVKTISIISIASGDAGMVSGQMRDMESESKEISLDELKIIHMEKTGALIRASLKCGSVIGGSDDEGIKHLDEYGKLIGLAFQVTDDILNITGDAKIMGKATGSDEKNNKATYPNLMGLDNSIKYAKDLIDESIEHLNFFKKRAIPLKAIAEYILNRNK